MGVSLLSLIEIIYYVSLRLVCFKKNKETHLDTAKPPETH